MGSIEKRESRGGRRRIDALFAFAALGVVFLAWTAIATAQVPQCEPADAAPPTIVASADGGAAAEVNENVELAQEEKNIARLNGMYNLATDLVGNQHVIVAPVGFVGKRCGSGHDVYNCSAPVENSGGIAGVVLMPLVGLGAGHGVDIWPHVESDQVANGFYQFDMQYRKMRDALAEPLGLPEASQASDEVLRERFNTLARTFSSTLARTLKEKGYLAHKEDLVSMQQCLGTLTSAPVLPRGSTSPALLTNPSCYCATGLKQSAQQPSWTMPQKLKYLNALWQEYDLLIDAQPLARHWLFVGPLAGVSITDNFGDLLYGGGLEAGWKAGFRITAAAGWRSDMAGSVDRLNFDAVGWWVGLGLSGQLGDDLMDAILGVNHVFTSGLSGVGN